MNELYLAGDIYFSFSFKTSYVNEMEDGRRKQSTLEWENGCIYNAIIKDVDGDIVIQIKGFNKEGNQNSISFMARQWNDFIPYFEFGKYLEIHEAYINESPIKLDLLSTRLSKATSGHDCYYCFYIDKYQYSYIQKDERYSISYYLSLTSKNLIGALELEPFPGEVKSKQITLKSLSCTVSKNKESELFPIKIEFNKTDLSRNNLDKEFRLLCDIVSFYYAVPIECCVSVEYEKNIVRISKEISRYNVGERINRNRNLCYLNYGISHRFIDFLTAIYEKRTELEDNLELLHTTINDYVRSFNLDERSCFLVLYSVLETYSKKIEQSILPEKEEFHEKMKTVFDSMYSDFIQKLEVVNNDYYIYLWEKAKETFSVKDTHSIVKLFKIHNIDNDIINKEIKKAKVCNDKHKIKNISDLRNQLMHNRNIDNICKLPMDVINSKLSFAVCIILLYNLGFNHITFYEDWKLLSILKEDLINLCNCELHK